MYVREGQQVMRYLKACPPFRAFTPQQIGMAVFLVEGAYLHRSIVSVELAALDIEAKLADFSSVGIVDSIEGAKLMMPVRENRELVNHARRRVLGSNLGNASR